MKIRFLIALLIIFSLSGCAKLAEKSLEDDVVEFFAQQGVIDFDIECHRPLIARMGSCLFLGSPESVERLVTRLNLKDVEAKNTEFGYKVFGEFIKDMSNDEYKKYRCYSNPVFSNIKSVKVYVGLNRPPKLKINSDNRFSYFLLLYRTDNDEVCIEFGYS